MTISKTRPSGHWQPRKATVFTLLAIGLAMLASVPHLPAQTGAPPPPPAAMLSSNRFLFAVDTSSGMKRLQPDVLHVIQDIIRSDANGQLHNGDTIGSWTFNDNLYTGNLPLQDWVAEDSEEIALRMTEFFRQQTFEKKSRLDVAMSGLSAVVKHSDIITIFIISDGSSPMAGTPFDQQINSSYQAAVQEMKKDRRPIVTVLQGTGGRLIRYTVNALPWPVVIPEVPIPLKLVNAPPPKPAATNAAVMPTSTASTPPAVAPTNTALPPVVKPAQPAPQMPAAVPAPIPLPPATPAALAPVITPSPVPLRPGPVAATPPAPAKTSNPVVAVNTVPAPAPKPAATPQPAEKPAAPVEAKPAHSPTMGTNAAAPAPKPTLIAQGTALVKSFAAEHPRILLITGGVLILAALGLMLVLARRSRRAARISLISQLMDDQQQQ